MGGSSVDPKHQGPKSFKKTTREFVGERNETMAMLRSEVIECERCLATWQTAPDRSRQALDAAVNRIAKHIQREDSYELRQRWDALLLKPAQNLAVQARLLGSAHSHTQKVLRKTFEGFRTIYHEHRLWRASLREALEDVEDFRPVITRKPNASVPHRKYALEPKHLMGLDRNALHALYDQLVLSKGFGAITQNTMQAFMEEGAKRGLFLPRPSAKQDHAHRLYLFYGFVVPRSLKEEWTILTSPQLIAARRRLTFAWHPDTAGHAIPPLLQRHYWNILRWTWAAIKTRRKQLWQLWRGYPPETPFDWRDTDIPPRELQDLLWREEVNRGLMLE